MARKRTRPKDITTMEDMRTYLNGNLEYEFPLVEECWHHAEQGVKETNKNIKIKNDTRTDGKTTPYARVAGRYFQLMGLEHFKKAGQELRNIAYREIREDEEQEAMDILLEDDTDEGEFIRELISIYFSHVKNTEEITFTIDRLADYYNNYEFNEGSDKFLVVSAVADELALRELYSLRARGGDNEKAIKETRDSYMKALGGLKVLKSDKKEDKAKDKFTAFVDELTKNGELRFKAKEYPKDQIDELIESTIRSIKGAYNE